jgi:single-strand DNA-binding protein
MLGGGNTGGGGIQNDNTQTPANNFEDTPQVSNEMDDEIPF